MRAVKGKRGIRLDKVESAGCNNRIKWIVSAVLIDEAFE